MLLALQNPLGFRSPLSCWDRDFGWSWLERVTKDFVHLEKRGGSDVCLQPSTQPVATAGRGHGPAQGVSIFSTQTQKTPPFPQESDAALHPPLTRGDLKSHYQQHYHTTVGCSQRFRTTGASFLCALLPEHPVPGSTGCLESHLSSAPASFSSNFRALLSDTKTGPPKQSKYWKLQVFCVF